MSAGQRSPLKFAGHLETPGPGKGPGAYPSAMVNASASMAMKCRPTFAAGP
jgi:hypothetical protein